MTAPVHPPHQSPGADAGADAGPALGGARSALIGTAGISAKIACAPGPIERTFTPNKSAVKAYAEQQGRFAKLFPALREQFHAVGG